MQVSHEDMKNEILTFANLKCTHVPNKWNVPLTDEELKTVQVLFVHNTTDEELYRLSRRLLFVRRNLEPYAGVKVVYSIRQQIREA
jgi:hypothetical protein